MDGLETCLRCLGQQFAGFDANAHRNWDMEGLLQQLKGLLEYLYLTIDGFALKEVTVRVALNTHLSNEQLSIFPEFVRRLVTLW